MITDGMYIPESALKQTIEYLEQKMLKKYKGGLFWEKTYKNRPRNFRFKSGSEVGVYRNTQEIHYQKKEYEEK